jgi:phosphohistidine phosphatase
MRLYLVRHGEAKSEEEDPARGLTEQGTRQAEAMARFLKPLGLRVDVVWHSGKARAAQTAEILAAAVQAKRGVQEHKGLAPKDDAEALAKEIRKAGDNVMIVGHLPLLRGLVSELVLGKPSREIVEFGLASVLCLEMDDPDDRARLLWMLNPKVLGEGKGKAKR